MNPLFAFFYLIFYLIYSYIESFVRLFIPRVKKSVEGQIVLVTGAGHGIGRELALQFSQLGAKLVLWDINKNQNESVAEEIEERGGFVRAYTVDVTSTDKIKTAARAVRRDVGHVQILINNAGVLNGGALLKMRENDIRRTIEINTVSHFWTAREFLPAMVDNDEGHVVAISSMAGRGGVAYLTDYTASKFAVVGFMEALRDEMRREGHHGIDFTTVCPFFVDTGMAKDIRSKLTPAMPIDWVASQIVDGVCRNKRDVFVPSSQGPFIKLKSFCPQKFLDKLMALLDFGINPQYH